MAIQHSTNSGDNYTDVNDLDPTDFAKTVESELYRAPDSKSPDARPNALRSEYVPPRVRDVRRRARTLPFGENSLRPLSERIAKVLSYGSVPRPVHEAANDARDLIQSARESLNACRDAEMPNMANGDPQARSAADAALARAELAVKRLEEIVVEHYGEMRQTLVDGLAEQQTKAREALQEALTAYSTWRRSISTASALGVELGLHGPGESWGVSTESKKVGDPARLSNGIADALKVAQSKDAVVTGQWMDGVEDSEGLPDFLVEYLREVTNGGDPSRWDIQVARRLLSVHPADGPAKESIALRDLRPINRQPVPNIFGEKAGPSGLVAKVDKSAPPKSSQRTAYVTPVGGSPMPYDEAKRQGLVD